MKSNTKSDRLGRFLAVRSLRCKGRDVTSKIILTPFELLARLVAMIPLPKKNLIRYHGIFGPNAKLREEVIENGAGQSEVQNNKKIYRPGFAKLMARVFEIDVLIFEPQYEGF